MTVNDPGSVSAYADESLPAYAEKLAWLEALEAEPSPDQQGRRFATRAWASVWPKLLAIVIVLAIWQLIHVSGWKKEIFPGPAATLANLGDQLRTALLWHAIRTTVQRAVVGFGLAVVIGTVVGALVSRIAPLRAAVGSLITALQTMPSIAWFPFAIILFGSNTSAILFVIVLGAAPSIANGLIAGVDYTPPLGADRRQLSGDRARPGREPGLLPGDRCFVQEKFECLRGPAEPVRAAEAPVTSRPGQVRLQRHEAGEARVPQRAQRFAQLPVALARRHNLPGRGQRVLDLEVDEVGPEQAVPVGEGPDAALHEIRRIEGGPQRG